MGAKKKVSHDNFVITFNKRGGGGARRGGRAPGRRAAGGGGGGGERSTTDVPWVLVMRHIEPFPFALRLDRPCSHCSRHLLYFFPTSLSLFSNWCF
jgi:hypothetical protein